jgi:hypothetical protein
MSRSSMILRCSLLRHDRQRRMDRRDDARPRIHVEAGHPGLVQRRQLREQQAAVQARHRKPSCDAQISLR